MTLRKVLYGIAFCVVVGPLSAILAVLSEGISLQHLLNGTLGLYVAERLLPPEAGGFELFARRTNIAFSVDASIWFLLISGVVLMIVRHRRLQKAGGPG